MKIGYACKHQQLPTSGKRITYTNFIKLSKKEQIEKLFKISELNLNNLETILIYNIKNNIKLFRMTPNIFPLATHSEVIEWWNPVPLFETKLKQIGKIINDNDMRVSIHPSQFVTFTSDNKETLRNSYNDMAVINNLLSGLCLRNEPDVILHVGGKYGNTKTAIRNLIANFNEFPSHWKSRLRFENDHHIYGTQETYHICDFLNIPMILDIQHHKYNSNKISLDVAFELFFKTWKNNKTPKIHLSSQSKLIDRHAHADYVLTEDFLEIYNYLKLRDFDIMLECKKTNDALLYLKNNLKINNIYL